MTKRLLPRDQKGRRGQERESMTAAGLGEGRALHNVAHADAKIILLRDFLPLPRVLDLFGPE